MTGSVNQHGQLQAIGGINEKVEGFTPARRSSSARPSALSYAVPLTSTAAS